GKARVSERTPGKNAQGPLTFIHPSCISLAVGGRRPILVVDRIDVGRCLPTAGAEAGPAGAVRRKRDGRLRHVVVIVALEEVVAHPDRKSTRLNSSHVSISYAVFCLKK